jgi:hypothetical protein
MGSREWEAGNGKQGMGSREWEAGNGKQGMGSREWEAGNGNRKREQEKIGRVRLGRVGVGWKGFLGV